MEAQTTDTPSGHNGHQQGRPTIGLLTYGASDPNSRTLWRGVADAATKHDTNLICFPGRPLHSRREFEAQANVLYDLASSQNVDGLLIWLAAIGHQAAPQQVKAFPQRYGQLPMVTVGLLTEGTPGIVVDNYGGMRAVVDHLIHVHYRKHIAFVSGPEGHAEAGERYRAYRDALAEAGLPMLPRLIVPGDFHESGGTAAALALLGQKDLRFDGLVAASDNMAIGAMKELQAHGLRIGDDVAVGGLNDESQGRFVTPPLTTATLRFYEQGYQATERLLDLLRGRSVPPQITLPAQIIIRQSCGCSDPLAARAAARATPPSHMHPADCLSRQRKAILVELMQWADPTMDELTRRQAGQLLDSLQREVNGEGAGGFLEVLRHVLAESTAAGLAVSFWHDALSIFRRELEACSGAATIGEAAWHQARVLVGEAAQRIQAYEVLRAEERTRRLGRVNQTLSATLNLAELGEVITHELPELGIPSCYLSLYEDPLAPILRSKLIVAYDHRGRIELPQNAQCFPSPQLLPRELLEPSRRFSFVAEPLYFRQDQLGFVLFEAVPNEEETYEFLRGELSGALKRTQLVAHNLELYNEAVKARQAAEEGRRLAETGQKMAQEADQLKSQFLATVSHELRTPLSLIVSTIDMMRHDAADSAVAWPEQHSHDLNSIHVSAQHLARLIGDVLDLASGQAGELRLTCEVVQVADVLHKASDLAEPMARAKGLAWRTDISDNLPLVWGDRTRLQQVILNLISNAIKFTEHGSVWLWTEAHKSHVLIAVSDTGIGIPPDERETIFDEFHQSQRTSQRGYGGIGLGLAISRHLIQLHGGQIGVLSSGAEDTGSTFYFVLPAIARPLIEPSELSSRSGKVLLLAEQPGSAERTKAYLMGRGFEIESLDTSQNPDWLSQIVAAPPDAVVLDYQPAVEHGWELMQTLKLNVETSDIPVLFYALPTGQEMGSVLTLDYLTKPLSQEQLTAALARQGLETRRSQERTILIVDDDLAMLDLHTRIVQGRVPDCHILQAHNGSEALEIMSHARPDLIILDLMMPVMDGFTMLQAMRETPATRNVPVIVLTAQILTRQDMARLQRGVTAVLGKEIFTSNEVLNLVETALARNKRLGSEAQRMVRLAMAYIHEHYAEAIDRAQLAKHLSVNERYLTRCFRTETGLTPFTYLTRYRIQQARALLETGQMSLAQVALACGFSDSSHFNRVFQKEVGVPPGAYRHGERPPSPR